LDSKLFEEFWFSREVDGPDSGTHHASRVRIVITAYLRLILENALIITQFDWIFAGHESDPRRGAHRLRIHVVEHDAVERQRVDVGSEDFVGPVITQIVPSL